jgi:hypothetical protein
MRYHQSRALVGWVIVLGLVGCGPVGASGGDDHGNGGGNGAWDAAGQLDAAWPPQGQPDGGTDPASCHAQTFEPTRAGDPDIMLVVDMSTSMDDGTQSPSIYDVTTQAIGQTITNLGPSAPIAWGLIFFPVDGACGGATAPSVQVALGNGAQVVSAIQAATPNGSTPTHKGINLATSYLGGLNDGRGHYILLATDGAPNCDPGDTQPISTKRCQSDADCAATEFCYLVPPLGGLCELRPLDLAVHSIENALAAGIKTFVVGLSIDAASLDTLNRMADAGGAAQPGANRFYPANDQATLAAALASITSEVISCTFALDSPPLDMSYVYVSVGGAAVSQDPSHANGWDITATTLTFYGAACQALQANPDSVSIVYGCPPVS